MIARTSIHAAPASWRAGAGWLSLPLGALIRWLQVPSRDTVVFAPRRPAASASDRGATDLRAGLAAWRRSAALLRMCAVARRWLVAAAVAALVLALVAHWLSPLPAWFVVAVPLALAALAIGMQSRHTPSLGAIARLADRDLALREQLASGLELAEGQIGIRDAVLQSRLEARAASLLGQARATWELRALPARREWGALVVLWAGVALLLVLPRSASAPHRALSGAETAAAVPASAAPYQYAFPVPTLPPSRAHTAVQLQIEVVQTPVAARPSPKASRRPTHGAAPALSAGAKRPAARPALPSPGAGTAGKGTKSANGRGGLLPAAPDAPQARQQSGVPGSSSMSVYTSRYRVVPPSGNAPALPSQSGKSQGGPPGQASSRATSSSQGQGSSASRPGTSAPNGHVGTGGAPPSSTGLLYMGGKRLLPSQLPKPGLITGKGTFTGRGTPGGLTPGTNRSTGQGRSSSRSTAQAGKGQQLTLQSPYGARNGANQQSIQQQGKGGSTTGQTRVSLGAQQGGLHSIDYVLPDANFVAPGDRALVSRFFVPRATG